MNSRSKTAPSSKEPGKMKHYLKAFSVLLMLFISLSMGDRVHAASLDVSVSPSSLSLRVDPQGRISGSRDVTVRVAREDKPEGVFQSCDKVAVATVDSPDYSEREVSRLNPSMCTFTRNLSFKPFGEEEIKETCRGRTGGTYDISKFRIVHLWGAPGSASNLIMDSKAVELKARVTCAGPSPATSTAQTGGGRTCDLSGPWKVWTLYPSKKKEVLAFIQPRTIIASTSGTGVGIPLYRYTTYDINPSNSIKAEGQAVVKNDQLRIYARIPSQQKHMFFDGTFSKDCKTATGDLYTSYRARHVGPYNIERLEGKRPSIIQKPEVKGRQKPWQLDRKRRRMGN